MDKIKSDITYGCGFTCKFSWIAHGVELAHAGHIVALVTGMVTGMALIYCAGLALGAIFTRYVPMAKKLWVPVQQLLQSLV
jgi:hypothetical protein